MLLEAYNTHNYSLPVRKALFAGLADIVRSGNRQIRDREFTIWMGDYGSMNEYFCVAVPYGITYRVTNTLGKYLDKLDGFSFLESGSIPYMPLIPIYGYDHGLVVEYTYEEKLMGRMKVDREYGTGICVLYKQQMSREFFEREFG